MLSPMELHTALSSETHDLMLVDVRSQDEFADGHIPQSLNLPLDQLNAQLHQLPRDKMIVLSCQSGNRSRSAREYLTTLGFENLKELEGGFMNWHTAGLPVNAPKQSVGASFPFSLFR